MALAAESPFIGEWKLDPLKTRLPDEMKVQDKGGNKYAFDFGVGAETIVVDGGDQPGYGGTLLSAKAEAPDTWIVERKKDGRLLLKATWKLSKDGSTLTDYYREFESDGSTLNMDYVYQRTGGGAEQGPSVDRGASSSIRRVDERNLVITDKTGGKVTDTEEIGLSDDLKNLTITVHIAGREKPNVMVFERR